MIGAAALLAIRAMDVRALAGYCTRMRTLVLSYDDGPGPMLSQRLMDMLDSRGVKATWFALGCRAQRSPGAMDELVARGHEIGCHTYEHRHAWRETPKRAAEDVERGFEALARWLPARPLFRPPYGKLTRASCRAAMEHGARLAWWTHAIGDTNRVLAEPGAAVARVARDDGGVALLHDFDRGEERMAYVLDVTSRLLTLAEARSWRVCRLGDVLDEMQGITGAKVLHRATRSLRQAA